MIPAQPGTRAAIVNEQGWTGRDVVAFAIFETVDVSNDDLAEIVGPDPAYRDTDVDALVLAGEWGLVSASDLSGFWYVIAPDEPKPTQQEGARLYRQMQTARDRQMQPA